MRHRLVSTIVLSAALLAVSGLPAGAQDPATIGVTRSDLWLLRDSPSGGPATTSFHYGALTDGSPMLCDWNGDGARTPAVQRVWRQTRRWLIRESLDGGPADHDFHYGRIGDTEVCGDWDGDGVETPGVVRRRDDGLFIWHLRNELSGGPADITFAFGRLIDPIDPRDFTVPVVGDWNGDGQDTPGVVHMRYQRIEPHRWQLRNSNTGGVADLDFSYGERGTPIVGDWNGDGRDGPGLHVGPDWLLRNEASEGEPDLEIAYGRLSDTVVR